MNSAAGHGAAAGMAAAAAAENAAGPRLTRRATDGLALPRKPAGHPAQNGGSKAACGN